MIHSDEGREAFAALVLALLNADRSRGTCLGVVANTRFWTGGGGSPGTFPWCYVYDSIHPGSAEFETLIDRGGDDLDGAAHWLFSMCAVRLLTCQPVDPLSLSKTALCRFVENARKPKSASWACYYAGAVAKLHAFDLLDWLLDVAERGAGAPVHYSHEAYAEFGEDSVAMVYRVIGYLGQQLSGERRDRETALCRDALARGFERAHHSEDRGLTAGITTGFVYLGEFEPLLSALDAGEPWLHDVARKS